jgi:hypothetical protein
MLFFMSGPGSYLAGPAAGKRTWALEPGHRPSLSPACEGRAPPFFHNVPQKPLDIGPCHAYRHSTGRAPIFVGRPRDGATWLTVTARNRYSANLFGGRMGFQPLKPTKGHRSSAGLNGCSPQPRRRGESPAAPVAPVTDVAFALIVPGLTIALLTCLLGSVCIYASTAAATRLIASCFGAGNTSAWRRKESV